MHQAIKTQLVRYSRYDKFVFENRQNLLAKYVACVAPSQMTEESYNQFCEEVYEELKAEVKDN